MVRVAVVAAAGAAVLALSSGGCTAPTGPAGVAGVAAQAAGSAGDELYATSAGVVWSFTPSYKLGQVARSSDGGRTWHVVLPGPGPHTGLAMSGSFFLGPDLGWVVHQYQRDEGPDGSPAELTAVFGTSDGGKRWWRSAPLPGAGLNDELDFTDARHGWLYGMQWVEEGDEDWQLTEGLWRSSDGGHTWAKVHARLPFQGANDSADETCPDGTPWQVTFANQQDGWLTAGSCAAIGSASRVWRTTDGGLTWTPAALPAPPGGWRIASDTSSGVDVGITWITGSAGRTELLVAVSGPAGLDIETSVDGGQSWHLASRVASALGYGHIWFEPVNAGHWVVSAPGEVMRTSDAGRTWRVNPADMPRLDYTCFADGTGWFVGHTPRSIALAGTSVLASTDAGASWRPVLSPAVLRSGTPNATLGAWFGGCRGQAAWVEVRQDRYGRGPVSYDLLRTPDLGRTWQDVLHIGNGATIPRLRLPLSTGALGPSPLPAGLVLLPEPLALTSPSGAWLTLVTPNRSLALAVTADGGQHWKIRWFPAPRHDPSTAPAAPSAFPAGLPWLATTASDSRHAWVLFGSTNGSGASYLYATADGGSTWKRIATFR